MMIGYLLLLGAGVYFLFIKKGSSKIQLPTNKNAEEILKERFVNGEIDAETFKKMKETLNN